MTDETQPVVQTVSEPQKKKPWLAIVSVLVLVVVLAAGYFVIVGKSRAGKSNGSGNGSRSGGSESSDISWQMMNDGSYQPSGTAPDCASPLVLAAPTDLTKVVSVLYPGQSRGGNYKPHGGLRFADGENNVMVTVPMDAAVTDGSRYLVDGEIQYTFDFVNPCGIKYRLGHLRTLSATFASLAEQFPAAQDMDSRTTQINPPVMVKAGDTVATAVGLLGEGNSFLDFGVYDLRKFNEASKDATFQAAHSDDKDQAWHAICWFDVLSPENEAIIRNLPATAPGSESDYCK